MNRSLTGAQATKSSGPAQNSEPQCVTGTLWFRMQQKPCWSALTRDHPRLGRSTEDRSNPRFPLRDAPSPTLRAETPGTLTRLCRRGEHDQAPRCGQVWPSQWGRFRLT